MSLGPKVGDWLDERTGWRAVARAWIEHPAAGGGTWLAAIGASVASTLGVLALTGVVLMTAYAPSPQSAWASVHYVQFVQDRGWIIRGLHYWAAQALITLAAIHVLHGAFVASYCNKREIEWWAMLLVLGLSIGAGITGGLLPWDQRGWWARVVEGNIVGLAPAVGGFLEEMMSGGSELGALGLSRAYTLHVVVLPLLFVVAVVGRRVLAGRGASGGAAVASRQTAQALLAFAAVVAVLFALTGGAHGARLEGPADPLSDYPARPEWFLLPLYQLRKFFHGAGEFWGTTLVPGAAAAYLVLLPWIDRPSRARVVALLPLLAIFGGAVGLSVAALRHDAHDKQYLKMRAKADTLDSLANRVANSGIPPAGGLALLRESPELRGRVVFDAHCASCHVLGDLGDPQKATATKLDGWSTVEWIQKMIHDPDAPEFFGRGPFKGQMPSVDVRPKDQAPDEPWSPMTKSEAEKHAVAVFLAAEGDEPGDPPSAGAAAERALGQKIVGERCTTCHLYKGEGDDEGSEKAPELSKYASLAWTRAQVANPASPATYRPKALDPDLKKHMPRFDGDLSTADIDLVARWTRATARGIPIR